MDIDLNCDCGESFGSWVMGNDRAVLAHVSSANIACGAHAGDPDVMRATIRLAKELGLQIGAHPGYPDLQGFGRRVLALSAAEAANSMLTQIGALDALARVEGMRLAYVKPHGALYNYAAVTPALAQALATAIAAYDASLILVALTGSALEHAGHQQGLCVAREAFADRVYEADGSLRSRTYADSMVLDYGQNLAQALSIVRDGFVIAHGGQQIQVQAETICLHGDAVGAAERAAFVRQGLEQAGVRVLPMTRY